MAQTKTEIQAMLTGAGTSPRHRFGQNFMIDQNLVRLVADAGQLSERDTVIEVGPGTGTLTEELLSRGGRVIAVEIDRDLAKMLREKFESNAKFELIEGDALAGKHEINEELIRACHLSGKPSEGSSVKLVANLPYNIASPLVIELLLAGVDLLAFTVQKEVADRLRATEKDEAYGPLSVIASMLSKVEVLRTLPPQAFWPAPKIDSALVRMVRRDDFDADRMRAFSRFVQKVFSFRRKTIRKALENSGVSNASTLLGELAIGERLRPENLSPAQLHAVFSRCDER